MAGVHAFRLFRYPPFPSFSVSTSLPTSCSSPPAISRSMFDLRRACGHSRPSGPRPSATAPSVTAIVCSIKRDAVGVGQQRERHCLEVLDRLSSRPALQPRPRSSRPARAVVPFSIARVAWRTAPRCPGWSSSFASQFRDDRVGHLLRGGGAVLEHVRARRGGAACRRCGPCPRRRPRRWRLRIRSAFCVSPTWSSIMHGRQDHGDRVDDRRVELLVLRRRAVRRLEDRDLLADVGASRRSPGRRPARRTRRRRCRRTCCCDTITP